MKRKVNNQHRSRIRRTSSTGTRISSNSSVHLSGMDGDDDDGNAMTYVHGNNETSIVTVNDSNISISNNTNNSTEVPQQLQVLPETTAYWSREPYAWSSSTATTTTKSSLRSDDDPSPQLPPPLLTSSKCSKAFYDVFRNTYYSDIGIIDIERPNFLLSIIVESSSHPSGLNALFAQPYMYAGPGLGNIDICPLQTCIAGGRTHDSVTFASICTVPECTAYDFASEDFISTITRQYDYAITPTTPSETIDLGREYVLLLRRMADINKFLKTGWTCGDFMVPFDLFPFGLPYLILCCTFVLLSMFGTIHCRRQRKQIWDGSTPTTTTTTATSHQQQHHSSPSSIIEEGESCALLEPITGGCNVPHLSGSHQSCNDAMSEGTKGYNNVSDRTTSNPNPNDSVWSTAFDIGQHLRRLTLPSSEETACLDGLRVGSTLWIILGHVLAIQSSSGAGYSNPSNFLPPTGLTTTFIGQLLFSSRLAVDTFLTISGYLVVHVLCNNKGLLDMNADRRLSSSRSWWKHVVVRYCSTIPVLVLTRVGRILPLYAMCLGFFTQIAPQLGNGPFWHQWINLLQPCHDYIWTNFLFINNFIPLQTPTTSTCFYHSWYLAVDMQLFILAPFIIYWYQYRRWQGQVVTVLLFLASVIITVYWSYIRGWSINTFDGRSVNRYDVEAYANPIIRAQAYFAGMYVAFVINNENDPFRRSYLCRATACHWTRRASMAVTLLIMLTITFITVTGAYVRRPCTYEEDPFLDLCGSIWTPNETFIYTAFGRTAWIIGLSTMLSMCIGKGIWNGGSDWNLVSCVLSWTCWRPLSQLSFGAYLIHPIVVFVWQLGDREKQVFRLITFGMDYISVCVVSFVAALCSSVLIECPCAILLKKCMVKMRNDDSKLLIKDDECTEPVHRRCREITNDLTSQDTTPISISPLTPPYDNYGSLNPPLALESSFKYRCPVLRHIN